MGFNDEFRLRTKSFALRILKLSQALPKNDAARIIGKQLFRSATSVAANYRAACRARSGAEFVSKLSIVVEEADESTFWLELLCEGGIVPKEKIEDLLNESIEITKIAASSRKNFNKK